MESTKSVKSIQNKNKIVQQLNLDAVLISQKAITDYTDIDIIDCSIEETENLKKINTKNICKPKIKKFKNQEKIIVKNSNNFKCRLNSSILCSKENYILKTETSLETKHSSNNSPDKPFLTKSKLKNIQQWLQNNDFESIQTPPFANLSITPVKFNREHQILERQKTYENETSSLDSDVEGVLKAVYGDEWMQQYVSKKSKTEPKKKKCLNEKFLTFTEVKGKRKPSANSVRRNILMNDYKNIRNQVDVLQVGFNESISSGFRLINFNESKESLTSFNINSPFDPIIKNQFKEKKNYQKKINLPSLSKNLQNEFLNYENKILKPERLAQNICKSTVQSPQKTFLGSLSVSTPLSQCHPDAQYYKLNFNSKKNELIKVLYKLFNSEVFDKKLPQNMNFSWNMKLRGTAGYCYNKRITKSTGDIIRISRIEFSSKIIDRADRLRDTMIHELCHAASWVIEGKLDGHGTIWNAWAAKAMNRFPELPLIKRCHNYDIVSKYLYKCTSCGYSIKRHSKSLDTEKKRCGHCFGVFKLYFNKKKKGVTEIPEYNTTATLPTPNKFALFVKDNYHVIRSTTKNAKHGEIMKILSQKYACTKNKISSPFK